MKNSSLELATIEARSLHLPFKQSFKHASAERQEMESLLVVVRDKVGRQGIGEGCPRSYVTGENLASAHAFVEEQRAEWLALCNLDAIREWVRNNARTIDAHPAAWAAVEIALLDLCGKMAGVPIECLLDVESTSNKFLYSAVIGDADEAAFRQQLTKYMQAGFGRFKIKLSGSLNDRAKVLALSEQGIDPQSVRADANNLWASADEAADYLNELGFSFWGIEEPLASGDYAGLAQLAERLDTRIILDESLLRVEQIKALPLLTGRWIANVRISKVGGLLRALDLIRALREHSIGIIVGAHVGETSILTRAALTAAWAAGPALLAQEGAFGTHLLSQDIVTPSLQFGPRGVLDAEDVPINAPGLGLGLSG